MKKITDEVIDVKTGEKISREIDVPDFPDQAEPIKIDLGDVKKLLDYAKSKGWI